MNNLKNVNKLKESIHSYEYKPSSLSYPDRRYELSSYPLMVRHFVSLITQKYGWLSLKDVYYKRIFDDKKLLDSYYSILNADERIDFLTFFTIDVHELTHHVDFMTTPFGVNYHYKLCAEYIAFQEFIPQLLRHPEIIVDDRNLKLLNFDDLLSSKNVDLELARRWNILKEKIRVFDAYFNKGKEKMRPIRGFDNYPSFQLFGANFESVLVNEFMLTIKIPNQTDYYLRPITILETRALIHSLRWILYQLGYSKSSVPEVVNYLSAYLQEDILPDYRFLFDLFLRIGEINSYPELENFDAKGIDRFLSIISALCWYALQSPPPVAETSLLDSSPVARLLLAAIVLEKDALEICHKILKGEKLGFNMEASFDRIDAANRKIDSLHGNSGLSPIRKILDASIGTLKQIKWMNREYVINEEIRKHFDHIFEIQEYQLEKRIQSGYSSTLADPLFGNPLYGMQDDTDFDQLIPSNYKPSRHVLAWCDFRENLVFKEIWKGRMIKAKARKLFGSLEEAASDGLEGLRFMENILMTYPVNYAIKACIDVNTSTGFVEIIVDDFFLPKITDPWSTEIEYRITDYALGSHAFLNIQLKEEKTNDFKKLNIIICPFKINSDTSYKNAIEVLLSQTVDPVTRQWPVKEAEILLVNPTFANMKIENLTPQEKKEMMLSKSNYFFCAMTLRFVALAGWYSHLLKFGMPSLDSDDIVYKANVCPFCRKL